jgi:hypothetical protein
MANMNSRDFQFQLIIAAENSELEQYRLPDSLSELLICQRHPTPADVLSPDIMINGLC